VFAANETEAIKEAVKEFKVAETLRDRIAARQDFLKTPHGLKGSTAGLTPPPANGSFGRFWGGLGEAKALTFC